MKKDRIKDLFLDQIRKVPIIEVACERVGVARSSIYRWIDEDKEFDKKLKEALAEGETMINEMSETQLISLIKEKNWAAISFWLRHRNPKFRERLEVTASLQAPQDKLDPEQEATVRKALQLASLLPREPSENKKEINNNNNP